MKLRRHVAAIAGSLAMLVGLGAPVLADSTTSVSVSIQENGAFTYGLWGAVSPSGNVKVTTNTGGTTETINQVLNMSDTFASSAGWHLYFSASSFSDGSGHQIANSNISMNSTNLWQINGDCLYGDSGDLVPNPTNPFQSITPNAGLPLPLGNQISIVTASSGRGCGPMVMGLWYTVNVPAGTYTGGGTAVYTSTLTLSNMAAPIS